MSYWGDGPEDSDFAFAAVAVAILRIKKKMLEDFEIIQEKSYPEQSIVASLVCLRLLGEQFPKALSVHFRKKDFEKAKIMFEDWYQKCADKIPRKYRKTLLEKAQAEFDLFQKRIFKK